MKTNLIKIIIPVATVASITTASIPLISCSNTTDDKKPSKKEPSVVKLNVSNVTDINDASTEESNTPLYAYSDNYDGVAKVDVYLPNDLVSSYTSGFSMWYQKGTRNGDKIYWWDERFTISEEETTIEFDYIHPIRFFAEIGINDPSQESSETGSFSNRDHQIKFVFGNMFETNCNVVLKGSLLSLLVDPYKSSHSSGIYARNALKGTDSYTFSSLFQGSTTLNEVDPRLLPFTTINPYCYASMFKDCKNLKSAPYLSADQYIPSGEQDPIEGIPEGCYEGMFYGCSGLPSAPHLPARKLSNNCYHQMFYGSPISSLSLGYVGSFIDEYFNGWLDSNPQTNCVVRYNGLDDPNNSVKAKDHTKYKTIQTSEEWIKANTKDIELSDDRNFGSIQSSSIGENKKAKFRAYNDFSYSDILPQFPTISSLTSIPADQMRLFDGSTKQEIENYTEKTVEQLPNVIVPRFVAKDKTNPKYTNLICDSAAQIKINNCTTVGTVKYSFDGGTSWKDLPESKSKTTADIPAGSNVIMYGNIQNTSKNSSSPVSLTITLKDTSITATPVKLSGNAMALVANNPQGVDPETGTQLTSANSYIFNSLFKNSTGLGEVSDNFLPSTYVPSYAYKDMFNGCTNLTTMPNLPATTNINESCYSQMFYGCKSLTSAYNTNATCKLHATAVAKSCFKGMFYNCSALEKAPILPTITTAADNCYQQMFYGCEKLTVDENFVFSATTAAPYCYNEMFNGCASIVSFPGETSIKLTTLAQDCCKNMFNGCSKLEIPLDMPAVNLIKAAYFGIYEGCSSLKRPAILGNQQLLTDDQTGAADKIFSGCSNICITDELSVSKHPGAVLCFKAWSDSNPYNLPYDVFLGAKGDYTLCSQKGYTDRLRSGGLYYYYFE